MADKVGTKTGEKTKAGRDVYKTPEGESVSEKSVTIKFGDNAYVNAPSIHDGVEYSEDKIKQMLLDGKIKPTSRHDTLEEALEAAQARSASLMNGGGMSIAKQMEMFENGGLLQEGGSVDEISGNEVPPGSLKEEVRDDIPAQLSEGEFVFPADVVRYYGLETLMEMRQRAKAGLARMEAMGQMGNADEATLPDDIPFGIEDLDIEEEDEYNYQVGGYVPGQYSGQGYGTYILPGTGVMQQQPSYLSTYGQQVSQQQPIDYGIYNVPSQQQFRPATYTPEPYTGPRFEDVIPTPTGAYDELRRYVNAQGQVRMIPFVDGKPLYPIPQGFYPEAEIQKQVPDAVAPTTGQTSVREGGDRSQDEMGGGDMKGAAASLGYTSGSGTLAGLGTAVAGAALGLPGLIGGFGKSPTYGNFGTIDPGTGAVFGQSNIPGAMGGTVAQGYSPITGQPVSVFSGTPSASYMGSSVASAFGFGTSKYSPPRLDAATPMGKLGLKSTLDIAVSNTLGYDVTISKERLEAMPSTAYKSQPISASMLGFSPTQASYSLAEKNTGTIGSDTGNITATDFGLGVVNKSNQVETPKGTVVQVDFKDGTKGSLLGTPEENKEVLDKYNQEKGHEPGPSGPSAPAASGGGGSGPPASEKGQGPSTGGTDTTGETDTGGSPSAGGGSEPDDDAGAPSAPSGNSMGDQGRDRGGRDGPDGGGGGSGGSSGGGSSCFAAGTKFIMEDGTTKNIEDIKIGDKLKLGGRVYSTIQGDGLIETWYNYGTTKVTGNHAIFENGEWKRVKDAKSAIPALHKEEILYTLINENHRMVAEDGVVYTDYDEVDNTGIEEDLLIQLNGQNAEATAA